MSAWSAGRLPFLFILQLKMFFCVREVVSAMALRNVLNKYRNCMVSRAISGPRTEARIMPNFFSTSCVSCLPSSDSLLSSDSSNEKKTEEKQPGDVGNTSVKASRLRTVLAGMKVEGLYKTGTATAHAPRVQEESRPHTRQKRKPETKEEESNDPRVEPELLAATDKIVEAFATKIDPSTIKSELLAKLTEHAGQTEMARTKGVNLSHLIAGMKIDRSKPRSDPGAVSLPQHLERSFQEMELPVRSMLGPLIEHERRQAQTDFAANRQHWRQDQRPPEKINLFGEPPLGIFKNFAAMQEKRDAVLTTWDKLEELSLEKLKKLPFKNAFEEMIMWTKEGKLWTFPINNEQGWDHEDNVDFSEHVFLDHLIADFPKKGPVKQFMDIVVYSLSKNAYLTVEEKEEHVDWFRKYFKEKHHVLVDVMGEELSAFTERESSVNDSRNESSQNL